MNTVNNVNVISPNVPGMVQVIVTATDTNECTNTIVLNIDVDSCFTGEPFWPNGIDELSGKDLANVYMDGSLLQVGIHPLVKENLDLRIFDLLGSQVHQSVVRQGSQPVDLSNHPSGIYIVTINSPENDLTFSRKVMKL